MTSSTEALTLYLILGWIFCGVVSLLYYLLCYRNNEVIEIRGELNQEVLINITPASITSRISFSENM